jgi:hypothetical protein
MGAAIPTRTATLALIHRSAVGPDGFRVRPRILVSGMAEGPASLPVVFHWMFLVGPFPAAGGVLCRFRWSVDGGEELFPAGLPGPGFGQVKADASGAGGDACRDVD